MKNQRFLLPGRFRLPLLATLLVIPNAWADDDERREERLQERREERIEERRDRLENEAERIQEQRERAQEAQNRRIRKSRDYYQQQYEQQRQNYAESIREAQQQYQNQVRDFETQRRQLLERQRQQYDTIQQQTNEQRQRWLQQQQYRETALQALRNQARQRQVIVQGNLQLGYPQNYVPRVEVQPQAGNVIRFSVNNAASITSQIVNTIRQLQDRRYLQEHNDLQQTLVRINQHGNRIYQLCQQNANQEQILQEYRQFRGDWRQFENYSNSWAQQDPEVRNYLWQLYQLDQTLRQAIGYQQQQTNAIDWERAEELAEDFSEECEELLEDVWEDHQNRTWPPGLAYRLQSLEKEAQNLASMIDNHQSTEQIRQKHDSLSFYMDQIANDLQRSYGQQYQNRIQNLYSYDRQLGAALRFSGNFTYSNYQYNQWGSVDRWRSLYQLALQLNQTSERLSQEIRQTFGPYDQDTAVYFLEPADLLERHSEQLVEFLQQGRSVYLIQGSWPNIQQLAQTLQNRSQQLNNYRFDWLERYTTECVQLTQQMAPYFKQ